MRCISLGVIASILLSEAAAAEQLAAPGDAKQKLSYSVGYQVGGDFRRLGLPIDAERVVQGVVDALAGSEPQMTPDEMRRTLTELNRQAAAAEEALLDAQDAN